MPESNGSILAASCLVGGGGGFRSLISCVLEGGDDGLGARDRAGLSLYLHLILLLSHRWHGFSNKSC